MILARCEGCRNSLKYSKNHIGKRIRCPNCGELVQLPEIPLAMVVTKQAETKGKPEGPVTTDSLIDIDLTPDVKKNDVKKNDVKKSVSPTVAGQANDDLIALDAEPELEVIDDDDDGDEYKLADDPKTPQQPFAPGVATPGTFTSGNSPAVALPPLTSDNASTMGLPIQPGQPNVPPPVTAAVSRAPGGLPSFEEYQSQQAANSNVPTTPTATPVPTTNVPTASPIQAVPVQPVTPVQAKPVPAQPVPVQATPVQAKPVPAKPVQAVPVQAVPVQAIPVQAVPVQAVPVQAKPVPAKPVQAKAIPTDSAPVDSTPPADKKNAFASEVPSDNRYGAPVASSLTDADSPAKADPPPQEENFQLAAGESDDCDALSDSEIQALSDSDAGI